MAFETQEVSPNSSISNNDLNIRKLQKENEEFFKTIEKLVEEKHSLNDKVFELEQEIKRLTQRKEVVEPCTSCEKLVHEVNSLNDKVSKLQNES